MVDLPQHNTNPSADNTGQSTGQDGISYNFAGFWRRVGAGIIDMLVLIGVAVVLEIINYSATGIWLAESILMDFVQFVINMLYFSLMESSKYQGTLGKLAFGLYVTDYDGNSVSFLRALGRNLAKIISTLILFIGFIMIAFTSKKQGLHDMIAKTLILKR